MSKLTTISVVLLLLCSCTITRSENYRFLGYGAGSVDRHDKTHANIPINNSIYEYKKTGILRDKKIRKEPYSYYFSICGNFNRIENLEARFV
jgi:hypothetical protein